MSTNKRFDESIYMSWCEEYKRGSTTYEIADRYGVSAVTVIYHLDKRGVDRRCRSLSQMSDPSKLNMNLSDEIKQIIIGSAIGDGSIKKQATAAILQLAHAENQKQWLEYKVNILKPIISPAKITTREGGSGRQRIYEARTLPHIFIEEIHEKSYLSSGRRTIAPLINDIDDIALAVIWGDDGSYGTNNESEYGILSVCRYPFEDNELLAKHLRNNFGIECSLLKKKSYNKMYSQIRISNRGMSSLREVIRDNLPGVMSYKIGA